MRCFVRKIGSSYHASFTFAGVSYTHSLRTTDEQEAEVRIGPIRDTLYRLAQGSLHMPPGANHKAFILSSGNVSEKPSPVKQLTVESLANQFIEWAASYYVKDGKPTNQNLIIRLALKVPSDLYGPAPALGFGPLDLKACREVFIQQGLSRTECNRRVRIIVQAFWWGVENALIPALNLEALKAVKPLSKGRTLARETDPVGPVPDAHVDKILGHLTAQVRAMVEIQRLTGMRPNEVIQMTIGDLTMAGPVWEYAPANHKTEHHSKDRVVMIGPRAQAILKPWLRTELHEPLFQPCEAIDALNEERRSERKTKLWPSHERHLERKRKLSPERVPADHYSVASYRRAIHRACDRAGVPRWSPNQLRHLASTKLRRATGDLDAVRCVLGHSDAETGAIYAEKDLEAARSVMLKFG